LPAKSVSGNRIVFTPTIVISYEKGEPYQPG
jgi:hypothetical protein